ncbi:uncharacterized protein LOC126833525 isoform X2 [Adelges cooleyi]|uniref:uncharacterized protein LOC126833525 isoform X2 n=1 Tax=Adelges cooleyi TaxID=133065 RepID=UPI00217FE81E|nr:uncharacterized protein LOC126833525 isoform X2 [Adelges cooleyi]
MSSDKLYDCLTNGNIYEDAALKNKLYAWFKEKGLIANLRAHIREQMITSLQDLDSWNTKEQNITSPKIQAFNLMIADFLIYQENLFTLSIFMAEIPLLGNLKEFSTYVNRMGVSSNSSLPKPRFQLCEVQDILEALGVHTSSDISKKVCQIYFSSDNTLPLIISLFKGFSSMHIDQNKLYETLSNKSLEKCITITNDNCEHNFNKWYHQTHYTKQLFVYNEYLKLKNQNKEIVDKVAEVEKMLTSQHSNILFDKKQIDYVTQQLRTEQQHLCQLIDILDEKEKKIQLSEADYHKKSQDVENQKCELKLREMEILKQEKLIEEGNLPKIVEEPKLIEFSHVKNLEAQNVYLTKELEDIKIKLNELQQYKTSECININEDKNNILNVEASLEKEIVSKLQKENEELREFITIQRNRIEELSCRASNLVKKIEKTQRVSPTYKDYRVRNVKKKLTFVDNLKPKNRSSQKNYSTTTTTDHSTTLLESDNQTEDEMIQEATARLKRIEVDKAKIKQDFESFQSQRLRSNNNQGQITNRKSYNEIRSYLSDDSDFGIFKTNRNKINLKELANRIGYHRSIRRANHSIPNDVETSPRIFRNTRTKGYSNDISPIKIPPSYRSYYESTNSNIQSPVSSSDRKVSPIDELNVKNKSQCTSPTSEKILSESNSLKEKKLDSNEIEFNIDDTAQTDIASKNPSNLSKTNDTKIHNNENIIGLSPKQENIQQDHLNLINSSFSKNNLESDNISLGSNKTDKSSDFWKSP